MIFVEIFAGCSGWSYRPWVGPFYPPNAKPGDFLKLYSHAFDCVEVDSSFYHIPGPITTRTWYQSTPSTFLFTAKMPKQITHEGGFVGYEKVLNYFLESLNQLQNKKGPVLIQLPPSLNYDNDWESLGKFLETLPSTFEFAVEFRHPSFFRSGVYSYLQSYNVTLAWSEVPYVEPEPVLTTKTVYLRLVGDRSVKESEFGNVVRDRVEVIRKWTERVRKVQGSVERAFIFSNNHFQGFGPATVNLVRRELGLQEIDWKERMKIAKPEGQRTLFDVED